MEDSNFLPASFNYILVLIQSHCYPCTTSNTCFEKVGKEKEIFPLSPLGPVLPRSNKSSQMSPWCLESTHHSQGRGVGDGNWSDLLNTCTLSAQLIKVKLPFMLSLFQPGELTVTIKPSSLVTVDHKECPKVHCTNAE